MAPSGVFAPLLICFCVVTSLGARLPPRGVGRVTSSSYYNKSSAELNAVIPTASASWRTGDTACRSFVHLANTVSLRAETLRKIGDGYRPDECRQACIESTDFVCVAAQMQRPATCFVTGFRLRNDYISVHYTRVCEHGPPCFRPMMGVSAGYTKSVAIPLQYIANADVHPLYCMAACELMTSCVGFDLLSVDGRPRCAFLDLQTFPSASFDLDIRRC